MSTEMFRGKVVSGIQWATTHGNWERMVCAHEDELSEIHEFEPGTLNVDLVIPEEWHPPRDEELRLAARRKGVQLGDQYKKGADFLKCGNYVHPDLIVIEINGKSLEGFIYYAGSPHSFDANGEPRQIQRRRLEILSKENLRERLGLTDVTHKTDVEVMIRVRSTEA